MLWENCARITVFCRRTSYNSHSKSKKVLCCFTKFMSARLKKTRNNGHYDQLSPLTPAWLNQSTTITTRSNEMNQSLVCDSAHDVFSVYLSWSCLDLVNHILRTWAEMIFTNRSIIIIALRKGYYVFFLFIQEKDKRPEGERDNEFLSNTRRWMEVNEEREKDWNLTLLIHSQIVDSSYRFRFRVLMRTAALMCDKNEILVQYYQQRFDTVINSALFLTSLCLTVEVLYC